MNFSDLTAGLEAWPDDAPSRLDIDRLHAGEIDGEAADALRARIARSPEAAAYLAARERGFDDAPIDPRASLAAIRRGMADAREARAARDPRAVLRRWLPLLAAAAVGAAAVFFFVGRGGPPVAPDPPIDTVRIKGDLRLRVFRRTASGAEEVLSGDPFAPGDALRFRAKLPEAGRVTVVGVEGDGTLYTAWPPPGAALSDRFEAGADVQLPEAVALDDVPGTETLHLVLCPDDVAPVCASAGAEAAPNCPEGCRSTPFVVRKVAP